MFGLSLWFIVLLIFIISTKENVKALGLKSPASDFSRHTIVLPKLHHGRTKREISSTKDTNGAHHAELEMRVEVNGEEHVLELRLNHDLIADGHAVRYQKDGKTVLYKPKKEELDLCQYHGRVRGKPSSRVALSTCHGVRGIIFDGEKTRYIEPAAGGELQSQHYLYEHTDLNTTNICGYEGDMPTNSSSNPMLKKKHNKPTSTRISNRYKRMADIEVHGPYNENKLSRYVELVLVADNSEFRAARGNMVAVHRKLKDLANIINFIYSPLNIFIALVGVEVWNTADKIQIEDDGDRTLDNFLNYRRTSLNIRMPNDNAILVTSIREEFDGGIVGKAFRGPICTWDASGGVAISHSEVIGLVATTIAHEMGHNFGMEHDSVACKCPDEKCIMSPSSTSVMPIHWSSCSLKSLALSFERGMDYCLRNKPKRLFDSPTCGNGFVEPGEQCDCGRVGEGDGNACAACCHPDTCMLRSNATCGAGTCCDLQTCRPKPAGALCRSAERECDLPEYCTGDSQFCPDDVYKMDTTPCGNDEAYCMRGSCRSHTDQCRLLWGPTGETGPDKCYLSNTHGNELGDCGYSLSSKVYRRCRKIDVKCGRLHCWRLNEQLEFGFGQRDLTHAQGIVNKDRVTFYHSAVIDLGLDVADPGMVPDGAKCGTDKMCLNARCVSVEAVRARIPAMESSVCPSNCSGHGVCNSRGHCHCEDGFAPPLCASPGLGGSEDSGPATDPNGRHYFLMIMLIIFLGIIPSVLVIIFLCIVSRRKGLLCWKKPNNWCSRE